MSVDYEEIVQGTVDEVKKIVEEEDLDPEKVLEAEKDNDNRVTLVEWLEERVSDPDSTESPVSGEGVVSRTVNAATNRFFVSGLIIGVALAFVALSSGAGLSGGLSASGVSDQVETYFSQNAEGIPLESVRVESAEKLEGSNLYTLDMVISASFLNRTVEQNQTAVVTSNGRYLFLSQPIDTEKPLADQIGGGGGAPAQ